MRLLTLSYHGLTLGAPVEIDMSTIPNGVVGIVGPNGAGKTTLLEAVVACFWRRLLTRDSLLAAVRDTAEITATVEHDGHEIRGVLTIDRARKRQTAALYVDDVEVTDGSGGARAYDAAARTYLPPLDPFRAAACSDQQHLGGFATASQADRRELLRRALGLERWGTYWRATRDAGAVLDTAIQRVRDRAGDLDAAQARAAEAAAEVERLRPLEAEAEAEKAAAARALDDATTVQRAAQAALDAAEEKIAAWTAEHERLEIADQSARITMEAARNALAGGNAAARDVDALTEAQDRHAAAESALRAAEDAARDAAADVDRLTAERAAVVAQYESATAQRDAGQRAVDQAEAALESLPGLREADADAERMRGEWRDLETDAERVADARAAVAQHDRRVSEIPAERAALTAREQRARSDAELLEHVPCGGGMVGGVDCSACPLLETATAARGGLPELLREIADADTAARTLADARPALLADVETCQAADERRRDLERQLATLGDTAAKLATAEGIASGLDEATAIRDTAAAQVAEITERGKTLRAELDIATTAREAAERTVSGAAMELAAAPDVSARLQAARDADARLPLLADALDAATKLHRDAAGALQRHEDGGRPAVAEDLRAAVKAAEAEVAQAGEVAGWTNAAWMRARKDLIAAQTAADIAAADVRRIKAAIAAAGPLEQHRAGLQVLERAASGAGVQALEMDAAGPGIGGEVNELLRVAYGGRFSMRLITQAPRADGKGTKEVCDVEVTDAERDWTGPLSMASGGERVFLEAALQLGMSTYLRARGGDWRTAWMDEADGALSAENASRWPDMLRAARVRSGVDHLLIVSHRPEVWRQADVVIRLDQGGAHVCDPSEV